MASVRQYEGSGRGSLPKFDTPDRRTVAETELLHPNPQCRLDAQIAAMLCAKVPDPFRSPGHRGLGENTAEAEEDSA